MPRVRVPIRRAGVRYSTRPGRPYPISRPPIAPARSGGLAKLLGGLGGALLCLLCLATMGLLGLFATFIAVTAYLGDVYRTLKSVNGANAGVSVNSLVLLAALFFATICKLRRAI